MNLFRKIESGLKEAIEYERCTVLAETKVLERITKDCDIEESKSIEGILENEDTGNN